MTDSQAQTQAQTETQSDRARFEAAVAAIAGPLSGRPLDQDLQGWLMAEHGPGSEAFETLARLTLAGVAQGWLADREGGGIRYGRVLKPGAAAGGFSVDVVRMPALAGPHHSHPNGEIDMILPLEPGAAFDGHGRGWLVYPPGSAHHPTVTGGAAVILYLLPEGAIAFTRA